MALLDVALPTLAQTLRDVRRGFNAWYRELGLDAFQKNNLLYPLSNINARVIQQLYLLAREQASQATPFGATGANLDAWLEIFAVQIPPPATATGTVSVTGADTTLPAGSFLASVDGLLYTTNTATIFGPVKETLDVAVTAEEVGAAYNRAPGDTLELALLADNLEPEAVVVALDGGSDPADDDAKTTLLQTRLAQSNTSGTAADYRLRALAFDVALGGVFIVEAGKGPGTIALFPINRLTVGQEPYEVNVATPAQIAALQTRFDDPTVRKSNDRPFVLELGLAPQTFDITIQPDNPDTRAAVTRALGNRLADDYSASGYTIANSELNAAIGGAEGVVAHTLNDVNGQGPAADIVAAFGQLATLGIVTFS